MPYWLPKGLALPHNENHLTFHFSGIKFEEQGDIVYRYMIEGLDTEWSSFIKETKADYRNIPQGKYTFKVRSRGRNMVWSEEASFNFKVLPPWWRTWWAYSCYFLIIVISAYGVVISRTNKLQKRKKELEEMVSEKTKELLVANEELQTANEEIQTVNDTLQVTLNTVEYQRDQIMSSINYAERIQASILPRDEYFQSLLKEHFVLFQPRDVVSGDFYWIYKTEEESHEGKIILAVVDCTGHGVPGAFMSMVGNALLNSIVKEKRIYQPNKILTQLNEGVSNALQQAQTRNRDGMDISIITIDLAKNQLEFAGAKNPLVYIQDGKLNRIKGNNMSVGGDYTDKKIDFTSHKIDISKPTTVYLYSDGFQDQFGGAQRRKFNSKSFRRLLHEIHTQEMKSQKTILEEVLFDWKGKSSQVDDILVIGFQV